MKKIFAPILLLLLVLSGCAKAVPADDAAKIFVDQMIYQKDTEAFKQNFDNGTALSETFEKSAHDFQQNFTQGLISSRSDITDEQANAITDKLTEQISQKTAYTVTTSKSGNLTMVTYQVNGLDFANIVKGTTSELMQQLMSDRSLAKDQNKIQQALIPILEEQITKAQAKSEPTNVMLEMKTERGKWVLVDGQEDQINSLYRVFLTGTKDQQTLDDELQQAVEEVTAELQEQLK